MALPILPALFFILGAPGILNGLANMFPPFPALMTRRGFKDRPDLIPTTDEIIHLRIRNVIDDTTYYDFIAQAGISKELADKLLFAAQSYLSALDYITLWRRGEIDESGLDTQLNILGIHKDQLDLVKKVTLYYPNPQDIVRFAVREAYTDSAVQEYGLDEDRPQEYIDAAGKAGLAPETAALYWRSHWELPSPQQVFEMLHRQIVTEDEVSRYLKAADYMPSWRDKLTKISYSPLTRVDIRRMYAAGVIGVSQVYKAYRDIGYDDNNAQLLTEFTTKVAETDETTTPKTDITRAYKAGLITRPSAYSDLIKAGYSNESVETTLDIIDEELKSEIIDIEADAIIDNYNRGIITIDEVRTQLTTLGVPPRMMSITIAREMAQARKRAKTASKADLDRWYKYGILSSKSYTQRMVSLGYNTDDIKLFTAENDIEYIHSTRKTYPYSDPMREFIDGNISEDELMTILKGLNYDTFDIDTFMSIALLLKG